MLYLGRWNSRFSGMEESQWQSLCLRRDMNRRYKDLEKERVQDWRDRRRLRKQKCVYTDSNNNDKKAH